jgi:HAD superfamily hydrolase (TIGR01490 family)
LIAAIFDLDGTLYTGHIGYGITRHHRTHRVKRAYLALFYIAHMPLWWLRRAGLVSEEATRGITASHMGWSMRGWTPQEAQKAFDWIAAEYVQPLVLPDVMARVREHQAAGHRVILVSGTPAPLLAAIGRQFGMEETVGTPLVLRRGRYTGASERPVCQGPHKALRLEAYLETTGSIAWEDSYAYADSYTDLPLLERFGHPVAVYPDPELAAHARSREWAIMDGNTVVNLELNKRE